MSPDCSQLTLVRHTRPEIQEGICYGQLDLPVAASFLTEAKAILANLSVPEVLVSSPLQRCTFLAEFLADAFGMPFVKDQRLCEMDFGKWEGLAWDALPRNEIDEWRDDFYHARPHGGESVEVFSNRVCSAVNEFRSTGRSHIIVCHAGVIKASTSRGESAEDFSSSVPFGGILKL